MRMKKEKMMEKEVYMLVFDGFADWELALICCEINKSGRYKVKTVGLSEQIVCSMGGLKVVPDITINDIDMEEVCLFMFPGGDMWLSEENHQVTSLLQELNRRNVLLAGICGATAAFGRAGLLQGIKHTSNTREFLQKHASSCCKEDYIDYPAVTDKNIITASGVGSVEIAYEIIKKLEIYDKEDQKQWLRIFRDKVIE